MTSTCSPWPQDTYMAIFSNSQNATCWQQEVWHIEMTLPYFSCISRLHACRPLFTVFLRPLGEPGARALSSLLAALILHCFHTKCIQCPFFKIHKYFSHLYFIYKTLYICRTLMLFFFFFCNYCFRNLFFVVLFCFKFVFLQVNYYM